MPPGKLRNQVNELIRWLMTLISAKVKPCYISQLSENVNNSDPYSIQNHSPALRTFYFLTKLYSDQVVFLIRKTMESNDPIKIVPALQVFTDVFQDVSQTENLKSEVMHSVVAVIQEDLKPDEEDIQLMCSKILQKMLSLKPYREKQVGVSSLKLLYALHPITSLHPVINSDMGQLWKKMIPQMLNILAGHTKEDLNQKEWEDRLLQFSSRSLVAINDDNWLEQLMEVILERINDFSNEDEEKAFLYKFFGCTLLTSRDVKLVKKMLSSAHKLPTRSCRRGRTRCLALNGTQCGASAVTSLTTFQCFYLILLL
ncbi:maestro heat-like repeat-containing protein family member 1 [Equus przewalskii]|uniref:Maestro heat-like repeat-containing protein family member 1 n=1 Tax=Equus przewalskii TaxID=9798 RepID=A0ABM4PHA5_EQUPR